jgi:hypothetical protein
LGMGIGQWLAGAARELRSWTRWCLGQSGVLGGQVEHLSGVSR